MTRSRSSARPLAAVYVLLVMYASLYPFSGWRWPAGAQWAQILQLPWLPVRLRFDEAMNLLGYIPLGTLLFVARVRRPSAAFGALAFAALTAALLAYAMEVLQHFLPGRVPSLRDAVLNACGAALGAAAGLVAWWRGWLQRWASWRARWFAEDGRGALVLLLLWPAALLFPAPVPLGLGSVFDEIGSLFEAALQGTAWAVQPEPAVTVLATPGARLAPWQELAAVALGLLAPCQLAFSAVAAPLRRLAAWSLILALGVGVTALSTALNFGPAHAGAWATARTWSALGAASLACMATLWLPMRMAAGLALVLLSALVTLVAQAPASPYFAASLQLWEQGQFIRFHGLAQWVGWLWPYAAISWLLLRMSRRG